MQFEGFNAMIDEYAHLKILKAIDSYFGYQKLRRTKLIVYTDAVI